MGHPPEALRAFPPLSHGCAMRAGGRIPRCGAALARLLLGWAAPVRKAVGHGMAPWINDPCRRRQLLKQ